MHKRMMQSAILLGVLSIPTFASADGGLLGNTLNKTSEIVETVTTGVVDTESEQEKVYQPVTKLVDSVYETTKTVTEALESDTPAVEVNISPNPSIKVNTGILEADVSQNPKVKVDTPIAKVEVDDSFKVEIDPVKIDVEVKKDPKPQISVQTPIMSVNTKNTNQSVRLRKEPQSPNQEVNDKAATIPAQKPVSTRTQEPKQIIKQNTETVEKNKPIWQDKIETTEPLGFDESRKQLSHVESVPFTVNSYNTAASTEVSAEKDFTGYLPLKPTDDYTHMKVSPVFHSGPSTPAKTVGAGGGIPLATYNGFEVSTSKEISNYSAKIRLFFDQWMNAPPSQPPQHSLFL